MSNCCFKFNGQLFNFGNGEEFIEVANYAALPTTGETSKIYVTLDNNKLYRWTGSVYVELAPQNIAAIINGASSKTTPADLDELGITDSAASYGLKKLTWANLKATLKTYFDTLYASVSTTITINGDSKNLSSNRSWDTFAIVPVQSVSSSATVTPTSANQLVVITAQAAALTLGAPTGSPAQGQPLMIRIKDNGTARSIAWTSGTGGYRAIGVTLPTTTVINKTTYVGCIYNSTDSRWDVIGVTTEA